MEKTLTKEEILEKYFPDFAWTNMVRQKASAAMDEYASSQSHSLPQSPSKGDTVNERLVEAAQNLVDLVDKDTVNFPEGTVFRMYLKQIKAALSSTTPKSDEEIEKMAEKELYKAMCEEMIKSNDLIELATREEFIASPFYSEEGAFVKKAMVQMYKAALSQTK